MWHSQLVFTPHTSVTAASLVQEMRQYKCLDEESEMYSEESEVKFLFDAVDEDSSSSSSSSSSSDKKARRQ